MGNFLIKSKSKVFSLLIRYLGIETLNNDAQLFILKGYLLLETLWSFIYWLTFSYIVLHVLSFINVNKRFKSKIGKSHLAVSEYIKRLEIDQLLERISNGKNRIGVQHSFKLKVPPRIVIELVKELISGI